MKEKCAERLIPPEQHKRQKPPGCETFGENWQKCKDSSAHSYSHGLDAAI